MTEHNHPLVPAGGVLPESVRGAERVVSIVQRVARPVLSSLGLVLVAVEVRGRGPKTLIRVVIERPLDQEDGGVSVDDCERAHVMIGHALDVEDPLPHAYMLEISSPGLDRPVRQRSDYERFRGRLARFKLAKPVLGQAVLVGRIHKLDGAQVWVEAVPSGKPGKHGEGVKLVAFPLADVLEARLEVEF